MPDLSRTRRLSPKRNSTQAADIPALVAEQLAHFGINAGTPFGAKLAKVATRLYDAHDDLNDLWKITLDTVQTLDRSDRIAYFNAQKFLSFQLAKLLDDLQNPSRRILLAGADASACAPVPQDPASPIGKLASLSFACQSV